jgi:hypothetical protein
LDAFNQREIDRQLENEKPITGEDLKQMVKDYRNLNKPNNDHAWFWRLKQNKNVYWSIKDDSLWKMMYKHFFVKDLKLFYWSVLIVIFSFTHVFAPPVDYSKKYESGILFYN